MNAIHLSSRAYNSLPRELRKTVLNQIADIASADVVGNVVGSRLGGAELAGVFEDKRVVAGRLVIVR